MKTPVLFYGENCVYCKKAKMLINRAVEKHPPYRMLPIRYICDERDEDGRYKHTMVPALYCNHKLVFEGNPDMADIQSWLAECLYDDE